MVVLAPGRGPADDLVRWACAPPAVEGSAKAPGIDLWQTHRLTPMALAADLAAAELARERRSPLSALAREAIAARATRQLEKAGTLEAFGPVTVFPGFPRALSRTLAELRNGSVPIDRLPRAGAPGRDLARLAEAYEHELARWQLADAADVYRQALDVLAPRVGAAAAGDAATGGAEDQVLPSSAHHHLLGQALLLLDLSPRSIVERDFLRALCAHSPSVLAIAPVGDEPGRRALAWVLGLDARQAPSTGAAIESGPGRVTIDLDDRPPGTRLGRLRRDIFAVSSGAVSSRGRGAEGEPDQPRRDDSLVFLSAPGEGRECVEIVRRVRDLSAADTAFDRVAVVLRDAMRYQPLIEEAFARARIPIYLSRGARRPHPAGRAFLALLACADEGLTASRFAEYMSLGQLPAPDASGEPPIKPVPWVEATGNQMVLATPVAPSPPTPPSAESGTDEPGTEELGTEELDQRSPRSPRRWERLLVDAAVVGGSARWARRLAGLEAELHLQLGELRDGPEAERERVLDRLQQLVSLRRFALPLIDQLDQLPVQETWGVWLGHLERLASRALRQPESVLAMLAELRTMDEVGPVGLADVRRALEDRLRFLTTDPPAQRYGRVFVGTPEDVRGRAFEVVFVPGLAEGIFPRRASEDPLLLDPARRLLEAGMETQDERFAHERLLLRLAIGAAAERLVVSYPSVDTEVGRARVPSFYALDIQRAADGTLPDLTRLEAMAAETAEVALGWPAPTDARRAIDEAEFDLAHLEPLLRAPETPPATGAPRPEQEPKQAHGSATGHEQEHELAELQASTQGAGRYLLETNPHLARALRRRWQRWHPKLNPCDGLVDPDSPTLAVLADHRLAARSYSPTALQQFAACPYRFLLYAVHRLRARDVPSPLEQLDPLTRGSLFHAVQFQLLNKLRAAGHLPVRAEQLEAARALADHELDTIARRYEEQLAPAVPEVWFSEIEGLRIDLHGWLHTVADQDGAFRPVHFELAFGLAPGPEQDPASREAPVPIPVSVGKHALLRGSIDLVEHEEATDTLRVTDHKTGMAFAKPKVQVGSGEILQPLLYSLAAQELLDRPVTAGQLFYCTRRGSYERRSVDLDDDGRQALRVVLTTIDHALENGLFPAAPRERACQYCDYRTICGPEEARRLEVKLGRPGERLSNAQAQSRQRLANLFAVRDMR